MKHKVVIITLIAVSALLQFRAEAATVTVIANNAADLVAKVNAANAGDIVNIPGGTYNITNANGNYGNYAASILKPKGGVTIIGGYNTPGTLTVITVSGNNAGHLFEIGTSGTATVTIKNITMQAEISEWPTIQGGGAVAVNGTNAKLQMEDCYIKNSSIGNSGGGLYVANSGYAKLINTTITGCSAQRGGALCLATNGTVEMEYCTFAQNATLYGGGGIYLYCPATLKVSNSTLTGNINDEYGTGGIGGENLSGCSITISNSVVSGNGSNQPGNDRGNDIPPGTSDEGGGIDIGGSIVGEDLIVSNDPDADCQPNCKYDDVIDPGDIVVDDTGGVVIPPPVVTDPNTGEEVDIDLPTAPGVVPPKDQGNKLEITNWRLTSDSVLCKDDDVSFSITIKDENSQGGDRYIYKLFRITQDSVYTKVDSVQSTNKTITLKAKVLAASATEIYEASISKTSSEAVKTKRVRVFVLPEAKARKIEHLKNTGNE